ncbi:Roadblock/LC7 family protein [Deinococcus proteolyticus MRP]|uniref:Roadblock/LC7 family protein n=1 Tax=Deinococcus proteolyticus (strain ATCC 35074 / DSM 20540 / JCM 6276 / NBRC 101906 / NCIMB 13154 / VKM Ac-1939 / CCM 2703 / MRP) TaxID=693977 RepID=F0RJF5_DEIPM|nr:MULTISPECIES: roadblock/LC7 domain-containing protein [Deinococcus]ADY25496.1 Roadblock/LC7 family protein [Deinococcus proteolyticus MRP]MCY1701615.1 roadblock/LC7 domain-containing protein [Deinococcus sp. SL84]
MIEPTLALYGDAYERVDRHLEELLKNTGVRYCLLVDRKGFVLSHKEAIWAPRPPALDSVATLVASNAAATSALANMLGEKAFSEQIHQGENGTLYVEAVGEDSLLTLIFDSTVPLGRVKVQTKKAVAEVAAILDELKDAPPVEFDEDFSKGASALLDDLLG